MLGQNKNIINHIQHLGETFLTNKLQDISKTQYPSTCSFQGTRSEDRIVRKIGIVLTTSLRAPLALYIDSGKLGSSLVRLGWA